jgi:hypothetical protein
VRPRAVCFFFASLTLQWLGFSFRCDAPKECPQVDKCFNSRHAVRSPFILASALLPSYAPVTLPPRRLRSSIFTHLFRVVRTIYPPSIPNFAGTPSYQAHLEALSSPSCCTSQPRFFSLDLRKRFLSLVSFCHGENGHTLKAGPTPILPLLCVPTSPDLPSYSVRLPSPFSLPCAFVSCESSHSLPFSLASSHSARLTSLRLMSIIIGLRLLPG